jgi:hypothetical protein
MEMWRFGYWLKEFLLQISGENVTKIQDDWNIFVTEAG